jgi:hypothetical protein
MLGVDIALVGIFVRVGWKGRVLLAIPLLQVLRPQALTFVFFGSIASLAKHESEITAYMDEFAAINGLTTSELMARFMNHTADTLVRPTRPAMAPKPCDGIANRVIPPLMRALIWPRRLPSVG